MPYLFLVSKFQWLSRKALCSQLQLGLMSQISRSTRPISLSWAWWCLGHRNDLIWTNTRRHLVWPKIEAAPSKGSLAAIHRDLYSSCHSRGLWLYLYPFSPSLGQHNNTERLIPAWLDWQPSQIWPSKGLSWLSWQLFDTCTRSPQGTRLWWRGHMAHLVLWRCLDSYKMFQGLCHWDR